jgi:catechol 2,3-dioxygenase-like lactoylglutathione lyase family enzyme
VTSSSIVVTLIASHEPSASLHRTTGVSESQAPYISVGSPVFQSDRQLTTSGVRHPFWTPEGACLKVRRMNLPLMGLSHLVLRVSDLDASAAWYIEVLGLEEFRREPDRYVGLRSASGTFRLGLLAGGEPNAGGALDHVALSVPGRDALDSWTAHLSALGVAHEGINPNPFGFSVDLFDPDGNNVELVSEA